MPTCTLNEWHCQIYDYGNCAEVRIGASMHGSKVASPLSLVIISTEFRSVSPVDFWDGSRNRIYIKRIIVIQVQVGTEMFD